MKLILLCTALALSCAPALAADEKKPPAKKPEAKKPEQPKKPAPKKEKTDMIEEDTVAALKPFDANGDFEIDLDEFKTIETEFKKNPKGPLKTFDKGKDGELDAMIDRAGINVKLGAAAPKKKPAAPAAKKPAPKKPAEKKPAEKPAAEPEKKS